MHAPDTHTKRIVACCMRMMICFLWFVGCFFHLGGSAAYAGEAVFSGLGNSVYFFKDGMYLRYQKGSSKPDRGFPKRITDETWPGLNPYKDDINAAMKVGSSVFFFLSDGQFIKYDLKDSQVVDGYPIAVSNDNWRGIEPYAKQISAAIRYNNTYAYFFLKDGRYILYDLENNQMSNGYPHRFDDSEWKGLSVSKEHINSMFSWSDDKIYIFTSDHKYLRFDRTNRYIDPEYPRTITSDSWPGLKFWLKKSTAIKVKKWDGTPFKAGSKVVLRLPRRMLGPITTGPGSQANGLYLTSDPFLAAASKKVNKRNIFTLYPIERKHEEGLQNNHPGIYQKVIIQGHDGKFVGVSQAHGGLLRVDRERTDATVFILDQTWGEHALLHVYKRNYTWKNHSSIPLVSRYLSTYFYSYGDHTYGSVNPGRAPTAGSLLEIYVVDDKK